MKSVFVGKEATIIKGKCAGLSGTVVGANSVTKKISIELESGSTIVTSWENVEQKL